MKQIIYAALMQIIMKQITYAALIQIIMKKITYAALIQIDTTNLYSNCYLIHKDIRFKNLPFWTVYIIVLFQKTF